MQVPVVVKIIDRLLKVIVGLSRTIYCLMNSIVKNLNLPRLYYERGLPGRKRS